MAAHHTQPNTDKVDTRVGVYKGTSNESEQLEEQQFETFCNYRFQREMVRDLLALDPERLECFTDKDYLDRLIMNTTRVLPTSTELDILNALENDIKRQYAPDVDMQQDSRLQDCRSMNLIDVSEGEDLESINLPLLFARLKHTSYQREPMYKLRHQHVCHPIS